jgi:HlyD family secretion protein
MPQMPRRMFGGQQRGGGRVGRIWVLEDGKPAMAIFRPGATDGRMTQVLPRGQTPGGGRMGGPMANDERFKQALERKVEPGVKVIVDEEAPKK